MATAESCTGGLVAHVVTQVPGSSAYYVGGVVAYANELKESLLAVPRVVLQAHGAVSAEAAAAMAEGACSALGADLAVATTGITGPDGGSAEKPVGLVFVAAARRGRASVVERHQWSHDRDGNKRAAAGAALRLAASMLAAPEGS